MSNSSFFSPPPQPQPMNSSSSLPMVPPPVAIGNGPGSGLSSTSKSIRRLSSRQNIISRRPSGVLSSNDSSANLFSKETKVVDGVAFTHTANLSKFSFKKTTVTAAKDDISDDSSEPEDLIEEINEGKARNFEFTNNKSLMRVFRAIIFLQMIALICDNPAVQFPPLFDVLCRAPLFYLIRFYSYPFVDAVYLIQKVWKRAILFFISLYHNFPRKFPKINPQLPSHRQLWTSPIEINYEIDFNDDRNWHTITHFSHYILGCGFFILAILLTLKTWQIRDYTDRDDVKKFILHYISDGWFFRGGLKILGFMMIACLVVVGILALLYLISQGNDYNAPKPIILGTIGCVCLAAIIGIFILAYFIIKAAEKVFIQYVSQNVNYTSAIILKRVVKSKLELAIGTVILIFLPVIYTLFRSLMIITDWNDNHVASHRLRFNYNTPCYYDAFPPYTKDLSESNCPNADSVSSSLPQRGQGFYDDANILPCDSLLGLSFYTVSFILTPLYIIIFLWFISSIISTATNQVVTSRWYDAVTSIVQRYIHEKTNFEKEFTFMERFVYSFQLELRNQERYLEDVLYWILVSIVSLVVHTIQYCILLPIYLLFAPLIFYVKRIALLVFNFDLERSTRHIKFITGEQIIDGIVGCVVHVVLLARNFLIRQFKELYRTWSRSLFVRRIRVYLHQIKLFLLCEEDVSEKTRQRKHDPLAYKTATTVNTKSGIKITTGEWRNNLKIKYREKQLKLILNKINNELSNVMMETVSDHTLVIDNMMDSVIDTAGYILLICPYRYTRLWFTYLLPIELILYSLIAAISSYYLNWHDRTYTLIGFHCLMIVITYYIQPYWSVIDRWIDWAGRIMIIFIGYGLIISDQSNGKESDNTSSSSTSSSSSTTYLDTGERHGFSKLIYVLSQTLHLLSSNASSNSTYFLLDLCMVAYIYLFVINILENIGVFRYFLRKIRQMQYAMHDYIVDFLIKYIDARSMGVENMHVGLPLIQQWDDIIRDQRRYGILPYPDVRPSSLLTIKEKLIEVKWASLFNLTINNMRTSLGLTLLHIVMCSADPEITRWLIHYYPSLLSQEDFQRDTPISIALKECAYYLLQYSLINNGEMDDGTTYADDDFYNNSFPDVLTMRDEIKYHGEIIPDAIVTYELSATERQHLEEFGYFIEQDLTKPKVEIGLIPAGLNHINTGTSILGKPSLFAQGLAKKREIAMNKSNNQVRELTALPPTKMEQQQQRRLSMQSVGFSSQIHVKRYPEDDFYDNFEGGKAAGWILLNIDVPENMIDNENYGSESDFDSDEDDLRYGIMESFQKNEPIGDSTTIQYIPRNHPILHAFLGNQVNENEDYMTGYDLIVRKKEVKHLTKRDRITMKSLIFHTTSGQNDMNKEYSQEKFKEKGTSKDKDPHQLLLLTQQQQQQHEYIQKNQEILWRLCKYADIFLSDQIFVHCFEMGWNVSTYKDLNKMSSKLQGLISQHLAVCFNLNPPRDFVRFSDWSTGIIENIREEYYDPQQDNDGSRNNTGGGTVNQAIKGLEQFTSMLISRKKGDKLNDDVFNDRIVQYLAECYASSRDEADLSDCDLGISARVAWRALIRSYRKKNCTFIIPGIFTPPKPIILMKLILQRNELDCGDAVLVADILLNQQTLIYLDLSYNRIASRGIQRICLGMKSHKSIRTLRLDYNRIGPYAGKALGSMIKIQQTLQVLTISHNRMGDIIRYPTTSLKETLYSAGKYIFYGLKNNKSLMCLDVSYNDLGPSIASVIPIAISRHPRLYSLNIAGNNIGTIAGVPMMYAISNIGIERKERRLPINDGEGSRGGGGGGSRGGGENDENDKKSESGKSEGKNKKRISILADLNLADNQFGAEFGVPLGQYVKNSRTLTSLDVSGNNLGPIGGNAFANALSNAYGYTSRKLEKELHESIKITKLKNRTKNQQLQHQHHGGDGDNEEEDKEEEEGNKQFPLHWKQHIILINLNISRNNLGPKNIIHIMEALQMPNCTLTSLNISNNPIGVSYEKAGKSFDAANAIRLGIMKCPCLNRIELNNLALDPPQILPILGGISNNCSLITLSMNNMIYDEPCCLQLSNTIAGCITLQNIHIRNIKMGPKGGALVCVNIERNISQLLSLDLTGSKLGFSALEPVFRSLTNSSCRLHTLYLADNEMDHEGGMSLCAALRLNHSIINLDISKNFLTSSVAMELADICKQYNHTSTAKDMSTTVPRLKLQKLLINDNPDIGPKGSKQLIINLATEWTTHLELRNCNLSESFAYEFSKLLKDVVVAWKYIDIRNNQIKKVGLNHIFWSLRVNRKIRILKLGSNHGGISLGTDTDTMGNHGIGLVRCLHENLILRYLDLSNLGLSSNAGINIFNSLQYNYSLHVLILHGNCLDDTCNTALETFLINNNIIQELDLSSNKFNGTLPFAIAEGLYENRSLQSLNLENTNFAIAGGSTLDIFTESLLLNHTLRRLNLNNNRMGTQWGLKMAEIISKTSTLQQFSLKNNRFDSRVGKALAQAYEHNMTLRELGVSSEEIGEEAYEKIKQIYISKRAPCHMDDVLHETSGYERKKYYENDEYDDDYYEVLYV